MTARDVPVAFGAALIGLLTGLLAGARGMAWVEDRHSRAARRAGNTPSDALYGTSEPRNPHRQSRSTNPAGTGSP